MRLSEIVVVPGDGEATVVTSAGSRSTPIRVARRYDDFAAALALAVSVGTSVRVEDRPHLPPPADGTILVCPPDVLDWSLTWVERRQWVTERTVLVDVERTRALERAEDLGLAAVVETAQYLAWVREERPPGPPGTAALYGRREVGRRIGATWPDPPALMSIRYALLSRPDLPDLPALLAAYLHEYVHTL